ncbi:MAG: histidine phosphatase family protein [Actinomycetota bacterium]|nr:histidine phosphatase family protein [Actinomycetota bacterium]
MSEVEAGYRQLQYRRGPGATEILLIRHGESAAAVPGEVPMLDGHGDPPLHPDGERQAERIAARLAHEQFAAIYVTNLCRTAQTAAPLAAKLGLTPGVEPDLREVFLGSWDGGLYRRHMSEGHPVAKQMIAEQRWDVIPGAEPADSFAARVHAGLSRITARHPDGRVAVFTHGGVIGQALAEASGARPFAFLGADNASISELIIAPDRWQIRRYNDTAHLDGLR